MIVLGLILLILGGRQHSVDDRPHRLIIGIAFGPGPMGTLLDVNTGTQSRPLNSH